MEPEPVSGPGSEAAIPANSVAPFVLKKPEYVVGRAYLRGPFTRQKVAGPKAVLLLRRESGGKNKDMCQAFVDGLPSMDILKELTDAKIIPTYWLMIANLAPQDWMNCKKLLADYDYEQAKALFAIYGLTDRKGPILLVADPSDNFVIVDLTKASKKDMKLFIGSWFQKIPNDGKLIVTSVTLFDRMRPFLCKMMGAANEHLKDKPDFTKPDTIIEQAGKAFRNVNWMGAGTLLIGRTFTSAFCPAPGAQSA